MTYPQMQIRAIFQITLLFLSCIAGSQNLLTNGDFESGGNGVGFIVNGAGYNQINPPFSGTTSAGDFAITTNPQPMNTAFFIADGDHTTGNGKMLIIDGNGNAGQPRFWRAGNAGGGVCGLIPGTTYLFGFWIKSVATTVTNTATRANIGYQITNASNIQIITGGPFAPLPANGWQQVCYVFTANAACVNIELWNNNTSLAGNDFAIDDLYVTPEPGCTIPTATPVLFCDGANATPTSVAFDFNNAGQTSFSYSYSINGGPLISGTMNSPSHFNVPNVPQGASVTFNLTWEGLCAPTLTQTCNAVCINTITPNFPAFAPICAGTPASQLPALPTSSPNGITGTWFPATVSGTNSGTYTFTPNDGQCAATQIINITVIPAVTPTFAPIPPVCQNAAPPVLPTSSTNATPITGTWSPAVSTANLGTTTYTFTPTAGQCVTATPVTTTITVISNNSPNFAPIAPICQGTPQSQLPVLATTSPTGVTGSWQPATISSAASANYLFTPNPGQCASQQTLSVTVSPRPVPTFSPYPEFCNGDTIPALPLVSNNGISGTWSPAINGTQTTTYSFTPDAGQCAATATLTITVNDREDPGFSDIAICLSDPAPILNNISPNEISGTWNPAVADNITGGSYTFTPDPGQCANPQTISVTVNQGDDLESINTTISNYFSENHTLTVTAQQPGIYMYQLDFGPLQESNVFYNVSPGLHTVTVHDPFGCSPPISQEELLVVGYPPYFTPNGDSVNDYWNIVGLNNSAQVFIFDRYGKLLKQLSPEGPGWDGTYNGERLPASDYWFMVDYFEGNRSSQYRSHFALKR